MDKNEAIWSVVIGIFFIAVAFLLAFGMYNDRILREKALEKGAPFCIDRVTR